MRRYHVTTFGCQMNAHDSERIKGMLEELGLGEARSREEADVIVFNTCTIREKPDTKFAAYMGNAAAQKRAQADTIIAVGGCYAEAQRDRLFSLYPDVDVAFGPGTIPHLGEWLGAGGFGVERGAWGTAEERQSAERLRMHRERRCRAWVQISMGCNSTCSYCIVPAVRGREVSRRPGDVLAEVTQLAQQGVRELTLLGQNVNSWGRDLLPEIHTEFGELLRACDAVEGIERVRFTSPHPKDFRRPVIEAMAECATVCEHAHLPLQSGSTRVLKAMRRTYSRERYLRLVDEPHGPEPRARTHAPQHDGQLHRVRSIGRPRRRADRARDLDDPRRVAGRRRSRLDGISHLGRGRPQRAQPERRGNERQPQVAHPVGEYRQDRGGERDSSPGEGERQQGLDGARSGEWERPPR